MNSENSGLFQNICNFHIWADNQVINHLKTLDELKLSQDLGDIIVNDTNCDSPSVRSLIEHMMMGFYMMSAKMENLQFEPKDTLKTIRSFNNKEILDEWKEIDNKFITLTRNNLGNNIRFGDQEYAISEEMIFAFLNHSVHHRAQLMIALRIVGENGCDTDFYTFLKKKKE
jgi:uncharacterized damage-inducible protein DinB